ncbi:MAG: hypothetical protein AAGA27_00545, partial [Pseudomonadota bacterium]
TFSFAYAHTSEKVLFSWSGVVNFAKSAPNFYGKLYIGIAPVKLCSPYGDDLCQQTALLSGPFNAGTYEMTDMAFLLKNENFNNQVAFQKIKTQLVGNGNSMNDIIDFSADVMPISSFIIDGKNVAHFKTELSNFSGYFGNSLILQTMIYSDKNYISITIHSKNKSIKDILKEGGEDIPYTATAYVDQH